MKYNHFITILCILLAACGRQDPSIASVVLNPVNTRQPLPTVIVQTAHSQQRLEPSIWNASAKRFGILPPTTVKVKDGQTIYTISRQHMVPLRTLIDRNRLSPPFSLKPGQNIIVDRPRVHIVGRGETLNSIAKLHQVDTYALGQMNGLATPFKVEVGQPLVLPSRITDVKLPPPRPVLERKTTPSQAFVTVLDTKKPVTKIGDSISPKSLQPKEARSGFKAPVQGKIIEDFGRHSGGIQNDGINIAASLGTPVKAVDHGVVAYVGRDIPSFGKLILVKHTDGWISAYAHVDKVTVQRGHQIRQGETIARIGKTGNVSQPQLHFELRRGRKPVDPTQYITF